MRYCEEEEKHGQEEGWNATLESLDPAQNLHGWQRRWRDSIRVHLQSVDKTMARSLQVTTENHE